MDHLRAVADHISLLGMVARTPIAAEVGKALLIALVTSYATTAMTAARLEERIAGLALRQDTCERTMRDHLAADLEERDRIARCEAHLEAKEHR